MSVNLDVVGHEMFHGVTDRTSRLDYANQSGALNESYSDIFGVLIANWEKPDFSTWNWKVGEGLTPDGKPFRDMQDPTRFDQPAHMRDFVFSPNTEGGDWGGVHTNSGIHNKAAYNIMTSLDNGRQLFTPQEIAAVFYLALTQQLSSTSQFNDSRRGIIISAQTFFRALSADQLTAKISAIERGFSAVGISS
jgi:Zn-dependent metalloprotease